MTESLEPAGRRRNQNFRDTHRLLIAKAQELVTRRGENALSIAGLARESGLNRTTVYYHFHTTEAMIAAVKQAAADRRAERADHSACTANPPSFRPGAAS